MYTAFFVSRKKFVYIVMYLLKTFDYIFNTFYPVLVEINENQGTFYVMNVRFHGPKQAFTGNT